MSELISRTGVVSAVGVLAELSACAVVVLLGVDVQAEIRNATMMNTNAILDCFKSDLSCVLFHNHSIPIPYSSK
ncbi:MAG: hypothetical protein A3K04_00275 [Gallionellales bacterium RBG_16_56_9]|nr:MAG: hypothetical protein A3K04_00275 [Gallionellales bacterium RBG_16_56_9]